MLTSEGEAPSNISQLIFRVKGTVDDFETPSEEMMQAIRSGNETTVKIPVNNGVVNTITLSSNGMTEELQRTSLLLIGSGNRGFSIRNADVDISEIYIVNGTDYTEKIGYFAEHSFAEDNASVLPTPPSGEGETAPPTGDFLTVTAAITALAALVSPYLLKKRKFK